MYHDSAAAICIDGEIIAAVQEERFSRVKNDCSFPLKSINFCLEIANTKISELDAIVFYDNPLLMLDRWITNIVELGENSEDMIEKSFSSVFKSRLWINKIILNRFPNVRPEKIFVLQHHISHAASAYYPSPFNEAAILTVDGVGEWTTTAIGVGEGNEIKLLKELKYPHSLGLLYSAFTYFCGFKVNSGEYKLMGLAPYGEPIYTELIKKEIINIKDDGSFALNLEYFNFQKTNSMISKEFSDLFGKKPRKPESEISKFYADIAASVQGVTEEIIVKLAKTAKKITKKNNLVMAGGVALNCVANGKLLKEKIFDNIWIQPAAGDCGGALGAALYASYNLGNFSKKSVELQKNSLLGPNYKNDDIKKFLDNRSAPYHFYEKKEDLYNIVSEYLDKGKIVGYFSGRMEFGPRALGARSIIADARKIEIPKKINLCVKKREGFRPFAPTVLEECTDIYFNFDGISPYMLFTTEVKNKYSDFVKNNKKISAELFYEYTSKINSQIPATTHVNNSARIQTVNGNDNPDFYLLLNTFYKLTGCPVLLNTSFNMRGEPIVCNIEDAYDTFLNTQIDILILENFLLYRDEQVSSIQNNKRKDCYELD